MIRPCGTPPADMNSGCTPDKDVQRFFALACSALGSVYQKLQKYELAENYFRRGIAQSQQYSNIYFLARNYNNLANLFLDNESERFCYPLRK